MRGFLSRSRWFFNASRSYVGRAPISQWVTAYVRFMWLSRKDGVIA